MFVLHQTLGLVDLILRPALRFWFIYIQDKTVLIWTQDGPNTEWKKQLLQPEPFPDVIWRVSWSLSGNILAVSCGDNKVTLWKENIDGAFVQIGDANENTQ